MNMKPKDRKIDIMGIVNITDDSYYRDSRCMDEGGNADIPKVLGRIGQMIREGATVIDIGACSTRPGSEPVGEENEWKGLNLCSMPYGGHFRKYQYPSIPIGPRSSAMPSVS